MAIRLVRFCAKLRKNRDYWVIADQLLDSGTSTGANVVEAKSSSSKREYIKFFEIALKSTNETIFWLIVVKEANSSLKEEARELQQEYEEIAKILCSSVLTMKNKNKI